MNRAIIAICLGLSTAYLTEVFGADEGALLGFNPDSAAAEKRLEVRFDQELNRDNLRNWMQRLTAHPHHLGSSYDKENAEFIAAQFRSWGYETRIEQFSVLFPTPKIRLLEMTAPEQYSATLKEPPIKGDSTSGLTAEQLPTYNAYAKDGDVSGQLVYANFGTPDDYEVLAENGIDVAGKIVITRYGGCWRGIKPKVAAEHGAIGCLIYSDPHEDGYFEGDVYPEGSWRNENAAQRGSVCDLPLYPGDPLTPGIGATADAQRLSIKDAPSLAKIPVLPISYADATPLLKAMRGPVAPEAWRGALPLTYHIGPGPATVHLKLECDWKQTLLYDVIARLTGDERPDEWVIRGNHHDAWVCGAEDPVSGTVALMEEARSIGKLAAQGWKPKRTIVYTVWDGEEPGLLGSTEWVETHAEELRRKAVAYVNSDTNDRGFLNAEGSHTLERLLNQVARDVQDPETRKTVAQRLRARKLIKATPGERNEISQRADIRIGALGSGSDYTPFLQHLGIPCLNIGYGGEEGGGCYHSIYDSFDHYTRFGDPDFQYGLVLARTCGRAMLRLADADMLPYEYSNFADTIGKYVQELTKLTDDMRAGTAETNGWISDKLLADVADPKLVYITPAAKPPVPYLNFAPLQNALASLQKSAADFERARRSAESRDKATLSKAKQAELDQALLQVELKLTGQGLPRRPWYRHVIYAPGFYTGYGVKTLPGIREAIEQRNWPEASEQIQVAAETLQSYSLGLDHCRELLEAH